MTDEHGAVRPAWDMGLGRSDWEEVLERARAARNGSRVTRRPAGADNSSPPSAARRYGDAEPRAASAANLSTYLAEAEAQLTAVAADALARIRAAASNQQGASAVALNDASTSTTAPIPAAALSRIKARAADIAASSASAAANVPGRDTSRTAAIHYVPSRLPSRVTVGQSKVPPPPLLPPPQQQQQQQQRARQDQVRLAPPETQQPSQRQRRSLAPVSTPPPQPTPAARRRAAVSSTLDTRIDALTAQLVSLRERYNLPRDAGSTLPLLRPQPLRPTPAVPASRRGDVSSRRGPATAGSPVLSFVAAARRASIESAVARGAAAAAVAASIGGDTATYRASPIWRGASRGSGIDNDDDRGPLEDDQTFTLPTGRSGAQSARGMSRGKTPRSSQPRPDHGEYDSDDHDGKRASAGVARGAAHSAGTRGKGADERALYTAGAAVPTGERGASDWSRYRIPQPQAPRPTNLRRPLATTPSFNHAAGGASRAPRRNSSTATPRQVRRVSVRRSSVGAHTLGRVGGTIPGVATLSAGGSSHATLPSTASSTFGSGHSPDLIPLPHWGRRADGAAPTTRPPWQRTHRLPSSVGNAAGSVKQRLSWVGNMQVVGTGMMLHQRRPGSSL